MKKISLKDVKNGLKRDEMRMIAGGSGSNEHPNYCNGDLCMVWIGNSYTMSGYCFGPIPCSSR